MVKYRLMMWKWYKDFRSVIDKNLTNTIFYGSLLLVLQYNEIGYKVKEFYIFEHWNLCSKSQRRQDAIWQYVYSYSSWE